MTACGFGAMLLLAGGLAGAHAADGSAAKTGTTGSSAARTGLAIELNKLEAHDTACRAYVVFANHSGTAYKALRLDLILFGTDGVIAKRMAVEAGALPQKKTSVRVFDIADLACTGIGQVLLNDVPVCEGADGQSPDCLSEISVSSRLARVPFEK